MMYRARINQPSELQPLHLYHGRVCIAQDAPGPMVDIGFTEGPVHTMRIPKLCISRCSLSSAPDTVPQYTKEQNELANAIIDKIRSERNV